MTKKILSLSFVLCIVATAFAQSEEKKPTKEATIEWLTEKLNEYAEDWENIHHTSVYVQAMDECIITIRLDRREDIFGKGEYEIFYIPTKFVKIEDRYMYFDAKVVRYYIHKDGKDTETELFERFDKDKNLYYWNLLSIKTDGEMAKRIENAIRHLATFCSKYQKSEDEPF